MADNASELFLRGRYADAVAAWEEKFNEDQLDSVLLWFAMFSLFFLFVLVLIIFFFCEIVILLLLILKWNCIESVKLNVKKHFLLIKRIFTLVFLKVNRFLFFFFSFVCCFFYLFYISFKEWH